MPQIWPTSRRQSVSGYLVFVCGVCSEGLQEPANEPSITELEYI